MSENSTIKERTNTVICSNQLGKTHRREHKLMATVWCSTIERRREFTVYLTINESSDFGFNTNTYSIFLEANVA